jgi:hypothetical protein
MLNYVCLSGGYLGGFLFGRKPFGDVRIQIREEVYEELATSSERTPVANSICILDWR